MTHESSDLTQCNYRQKHQYVASCLQLFTGAVGGAEWYLGLYSYGALKLTLFLCLIFIPISLSCFKTHSEEKTMLLSEEDDEASPETCSSLSVCWYVSALMCIFWVVWWLVDIVRYAENLTKDGHGIELVEW